MISPVRKTHPTSGRLASKRASSAMPATRSQDHFFVRRAADAGFQSRQGQRFPHQFVQATSSRSMRSSEASSFSGCWRAKPMAACKRASGERSSCETSCNKRRWEPSKFAVAGPCGRNPGRDRRSRRAVPCAIRSRVSSFPAATASNAPQMTDRFGEIPGQQGAEAETGQIPILIGIHGGGGGSWDEILLAAGMKTDRCAGRRFNHAMRGSISIRQATGPPPPAKPFGQQFPARLIDDIKPAPCPAAFSILPADRATLDPAMPEHHRRRIHQNAVRGPSRQRAIMIVRLSVQPDGRADATARDQQRQPEREKRISQTTGPRCLFLEELIADATHGLNRRAPFPTTELVANATQMHVDAAIVARQRTPKPVPIILACSPPDPRCGPGLRAD